MNNYQSIVFGCIKNSGLALSETMVGGARPTDTIKPFFKVYDMLRFS